MSVRSGMRGLGCKNVSQFVLRERVSRPRDAGASESDGYSTTHHGRRLKGRPRFAGCLQPSQRRRSEIIRGLSGGQRARGRKTTVSDASSLGLAGAKRPNAVVLPLWVGPLCR
jgi:hypothetical protein